MGNCNGKSKQAKENQPHPHHSSNGVDDNAEEPPRRSWSEIHKAQLKARREEEARQQESHHHHHHHHHLDAEISPAAEQPQQETHVSSTLEEHRPSPIGNPMTYSGVR